MSGRHSSSSRRSSTPSSSRRHHDRHRSSSSTSGSSSRQHQHQLRQPEAARQQTTAVLPPAVVSDENMRVLKRMRPEELRELSRAAAAIEKAKTEDRKKVNEFVAKNENFATIVGDCYICMEPLLNNIGTTKFGVLSWRCRCSLPQKAHSACLFSKICQGHAKCDMCHSAMLFEKTRRRGGQATIRFHRAAFRSDDADASSSDEDEEDQTVYGVQEEEEEEEEEEEAEERVEDVLERETAEQRTRRELAEMRDRRRQREIRRLAGW